MLSATRLVPANTCDLMTWHLCYRHHCGRRTLCRIILPPPLKFEYYIAWNHLNTFSYLFDQDKSLRYCMYLSNVYCRLCSHVTFLSSCHCDSRLKVNFHNCQLSGQKREAWYLTEGVSHWNPVSIETRLFMGNGEAATGQPAMVVMMLPKSTMI